MRIDKDKIDDEILALLFLTLDRNGRAWKGFDWEAMNRLHERGLIDDPANKAKSVWLTEEGGGAVGAAFPRDVCHRRELISMHFRPCRRMRIAALRQKHWGKNIRENKSTI